ncbi:hypothetical protein HYH03_016464 [Edaphochlamys debaryana]|uniref:Elongator complex protein 5 n=1 Tax=Edaphochlamys debaryana TaxID=47281 RepID=A0A836BRN4_9CHLO|nr:hypothetical protein HYH03_016464 [Edaphochlamys debaryana]|eukprot:KAG2484813.1 hypothetical protein HYH03_016464 [Edaphochlamys debaryana]
MHTDLHPPSALFGLRRLASCTLDLAPMSALQLQLAQRAVAAGAAAAGPGGGAAAGGEAAAAAQQIAGQIVCRTKRRTGRLKASSELFAVCLDDSSPAGAPGPGPGPGPLRFFPTPPALDASDPRALLQLSRPSAGPAGPAGAEAAGPAGAAAAAGGAAAGAGAAMGGGAGAGGVAGPEELARAVGSSMRLTLTEEERRAKQAVVLPYQHQGHARGATAAAYAAGDHEAYLPPAAGGRGPGAGRGGAGSGAAAAAVAGAGREGGGTADAPLGHILYVRDSASEADSDQDLDEDLDI